MLHRLVAFFFSAGLSITATAQSAADRQYQSYQRQHEQTVRAYSVPDRPVSSNTSPTRSGNSSSTSTNSNSPSSVRGNYTPSSQSSRSTQESDEYRPFTKEEAAAYAIEAAERNNRPKKYEQLIAEAGLEKNPENFPQLFKLAVQAGFTDYEAVQMAKASAGNSGSSTTSSTGSGATRFSNPLKVLRLYNGKTMESSVVTLENGRKYQGEWTNGWPSNGRMEYTDGGVFLGELYNNGNPAKGLLKYPGGESFEGEWRRTGLYKGKYTYNDGFFDGEFKNNEMYRGVYVTAAFKRIGEFYPGGQIKVGREIMYEIVTDGFFDSSGHHNGYMTSGTLQRLYNAKSSEIIADVPWRGGRLITWETPGTEYKRMMLFTLDGRTKAYGTKSDLTRVDLTGADAQKVLEGSKQALAELAKAKEGYREAIKWNPELLAGLK